MARNSTYSARVDTICYATQALPLLLKGCLAHRLLSFACNYYSWIGKKKATPKVLTDLMSIISNPDLLIDIYIMFKKKRIDDVVYFVSK